jgi:hypothetical protein
MSKSKEIGRNREGEVPLISFIRTPQPPRINLRIHATVLQSLSPLSPEKAHNCKGAKEDREAIATRPT